MPRLTILLGMAVMAAAPVFAQDGRPATYARAPGDTLRFREITHGSSTLEAPRGTLAISSEHDATVAITFLRGDTARAWYEALVLAVQSPQGDVRPGADHLDAPIPRVIRGSERPDASVRGLFPHAA
jgi:hypothetical protein